MHTRCIVTHLKKQVFERFVQPVALRCPGFGRADMQTSRFFLAPTGLDHRINALAIMTS